MGNFTSFTSSRNNTPQIPDMEEYQQLFGWDREKTVFAYQALEQFIKAINENNDLSTEKEMTIKDLFLTKQFSFRYIDLKLKDIVSALPFLVNLKTLYFRYTDNNEVIPADLFDNLANLKVLYLNTQTLSDNMFSHLKKLKRLHLDFNFLRDVPKNTFVGLDSLQDLNLSNNNISNLPKKVFYPLPNLVNLNLSTNSITELDKDIFSRNPNLYSLDLSYNQLHYLNENIFSQNIQLAKLKIKENKIKETEFPCLKK